MIPIHRASLTHPGYQGPTLIFCPWTYAMHHPMPSSCSFPRTSRPSEPRPALALGTRITRTPIILTSQHPLTTTCAGPDPPPMRTTQTNQVIASHPAPRNKTLKRSRQLRPHMFTLRRRHIACSQSIRRQRREVRKSGELAYRGRCGKDRVNVRASHSVEVQDFGVRRNCT